MEQELLKQQEHELREGCPKMFDHPERGIDEVYLGSQLCDVSGGNISIYHSEGMPSARLGTGAINPEDGFQCDPVFIKIDEFLEARHHHQQAKE